MSRLLASLTDVAVDYGRGARALGPFSLSVREQEIIALVGQSGCGKSTALRLLAGLEAPGSGQVVRSVAAGRTAMVFQSPTLAPWSDCLTNVRLPLDLAGENRATSEKRARDALWSVGLADAARARPRQLSGGMAMRVALARALVVEPELLLLDEPFAALDSVTRRRLVEMTHAIQARTGAGVVFVTHDVEEAVYLADRVVVMTRGPGRLHAERSLPGARPRPSSWRADPAFLSAVDAVSGDLEAAMEARP